MRRRFCIRRVCGTGAPPLLQCSGQKKGERGAAGLRTHRREILKQDMRADKMSASAASLLHEKGKGTKLYKCINKTYSFLAAMLYNHGRYIPDSPRAGANF